VAQVVVVAAREEALLVVDPRALVARETSDVEEEAGVVSSQTALVRLRELAATRAVRALLDVRHDLVESLADGAVV
jgi:hypothetical protein